VDLVKKPLNFGGQNPLSLCSFSNEVIGGDSSALRQFFQIDRRIWAVFFT